MDSYGCTRTLVDSCDDLCEAGDSIARNVSMVSQSIESRTRTALVGVAGSLESVFSSDVDGLGNIDKEPLRLLVILHRLDGRVQLVRCNVMEVSMVKIGRKGINEPTSQKEW